MYARLLYGLDIAMVVAVLQAVGLARRRLGSCGYCLVLMLFFILERILPHCLPRPLITGKR